MNLQTMQWGSVLDSGPSNAFTPPTSVGSRAHKLLWGHRPPQAARTDVTVGTFVLHLHVMGCPWPSSPPQ